ncbi:MAG: transposase [Chlamydiota bacterium]
MRRTIHTNIGRQRIRLSGALDINKHRVLIQEDTTLHAASTIAFFKKIEKSCENFVTICLFSENAYRCKNPFVQDYEKNSRIALRFLPPYSPNLHPMERSSKCTHEKVWWNQ